MRHDWEDIPEPLWPFMDHGVDPTVRSSDQWSGTALFSPKSGKFYVDPKTGQWDDKVSGDSGNVYGFLARMAEWYAEQITPEQKRELARHLGLPRKALAGLGLGWDDETDSYTTPVGNEKGTVVDIRRIRIRGGKLKRSTKGCKTGLLGADELARATPGKCTVWVVESETTRIALRWWLRSRGNRNDVVVAVLGAHTFKDRWVQLFRGHVVRLAYDHDEAGRTGQAKAIGMLRGVARSLEAIEWPEHWKEHWDVRDFVTYKLDNGVPDDKAWRKFDSLFRPAGAHGESSHGESPLAENIDPADAWSFADLLSVFRRHMRMDADLETALRVVLAVVLAAQVPGEMLFVFLVGSPGSGKTELVDKLDASPRAIVSSVITPKTLISGQRSDSDPSLLPKLNGLCWVLKDYSELLERHPMEQAEINSTLRGVFDGYVRRDYGNGCTREYRGIHLSHVAAVTHVINGRQLTGLGERYLKFVLDAPRGKDQTAYLMDVARKGRNEAKRNAEMREAVRYFLARKVDADGLPSFPEKRQRRLASLCQIVATVRTSVDREHYGDRELRSRPVPERPTRLFKQLILLGQLLATVEDKPEVDETTYAIVERVAFDSAVGFGLDIVQALQQLGGGGAVWQLAEATGLPRQTVERVMHDLELVGVARMRKQEGPRPPGSERAYAPNLWVLSKHLRTLWENARVSGDHVWRIAQSRGGSYRRRFKVRKRMEPELRGGNRLRIRVRRNGARVEGGRAGA